MLKKWLLLCKSKFSKSGHHWFYLSQRANGKAVFAILKQSVTGGAAAASSVLVDIPMSKVSSLVSTINCSESKASWKSSKTSWCSHWSAWGSSASAIHWRDQWVCWNQCVRWWIRKIHQIFLIFLTHRSPDRLSDPRVGLAENGVSTGSIGMSSEECCGGSYMISLSIL